MEAKRIWSIIRVAFFMLRKGMSKRKLMLDLNMMMKRGKVAGKAISNLMFHHSHAHHVSSAPREYEFSCSNTPNYAFHIPANKHRHHSHFFGCAHAPPTLDDDAATMNAVKAVLLEMLNNEAAAVEASPALPGFERSPMVCRQLRITDSPFPLRVDPDENCHVDKAAEDFIQKFYRELRQQKGMAEY
jgi:hypothetical protein